MLQNLTDICELKYMYMFVLSLVKINLSGKIHLYIRSYILKDFATPTQHFIQCQFLPEDQICPLRDDGIDKSDQLACIRYKNQNAVA